MNIKKKKKKWSISFLIRNRIRRDSDKQSGKSVNKKLAQELHKPVIEKFKKEKSMQDLRQHLGSRFSRNGIIVF